MTDFVSFADLQVRHLRRDDLTACGLPAASVPKTTASRDRVTCPRCADAAGAPR